MIKNTQRRTKNTTSPYHGASGHLSPGADVEEQRTGGLRAAFTLVELLVVISIIALLMGIIVPSYFSIREKAKYTKAKVTAKNLETAFKAYLDHYRVWPGEISDGTAHEIKDDVFNLLRERVDDSNNKDGLAFYEFESTNSADGALDAWSNPYDPPATWKTYCVQVDHDYNNQITRDSQDLYRTVLVWSPGADRTNDTSDDVRSWD